MLWLDSNYLCLLLKPMHAGDWVTGEISLSVDGAPLNLKLTVPANPVKPQLMLPIFQQLANSFTDIGVEMVEREHLQISCQKGCGACCRQPVPLAEIEVYHIAALVENLSEPRRTEVRSRFAAGVAHFQAMGWFERLAACTDEVALKEAVRAYFFEGVACPFLEDESCSIHPDRPVACREFLVTSPPENCSDPDESTVRQVPLPINASDGVRNVGRSQNLGKHNFVPFIRALEWAKSHPENFKRKTGTEWLGEFFG